MKFHDIYSKHHSLVLQKVPCLYRRQILNNTAELWEFSNAVNVSRTSSTVWIRCPKSRFRADEFAQSITPLIHCSVNNVLIKVTQVLNQSLFQKIFDVTNVLVSARSATSTTAGLAAW